MDYFQLRVCIKFLLRCSNLYSGDCMHMYNMYAASAISSPYHSLLNLVRQKRKGASEVRWLKTVLSSGTLSDKMAALILLVQVSGSEGEIVAF